MTLYRRILGYLRPYLGLFAISVVAMALFGALDAFSLTLLIPFLNVLFNEGGMAALEGDNMVHQLLDWTVGRIMPPGEPMIGLRNVLLVMFGVFLVKNVAMYVRYYTVIIIEQRVTRDMRDEIYGHLMKMDLPFFGRTKSGQIISRLTNDVDQLRSLVTANLAQALANLIQVAFLLWVLVSLSFRLTLVTLIALPLMVGLWNRFRERLRRGVLRVWDAVGELASHIQETVSGIRLIKASGAEAWESKRFQRLTREHYRAVVRNEAWRKFFPPATEMIIAVALLILLWYGSYMVLVQGALGASSFIVFAGVAMRLLSPVKWLGQFPAMVQPGLAAAERAFELLDQEPRIVDRPGARPVDGFQDAVRFVNVSFAYRAEEPVLRGIDLEIRRGDVVALVGASGAGKSTVANLVPRFYDPTAGRITLDGVDLRDYRIAALRSLMGIVTQETILFNDTVRANIAYGLGDVPQQELEAAAEAAHAAEFIDELEAGYDTVLGERGARLSGGQRQRIAIARALLRNAPILILDEATSALDTESELLVQDAIEHLMEHRTVIVIAHRLSTVRKADRIVVLEGGRIVETGRHQELLGREDGVYRRLYRLQFAAGDEAALRPSTP